MKSAARIKSPLQISIQDEDGSGGTVDPAAVDPTQPVPVADKDGEIGIAGNEPAADVQQVFRVASLPTPPDIAALQEQQSS